MFSIANNRRLSVMGRHMLFIFNLVVLSRDMLYRRGGGLGNSIESLITIVV